MCILFPVNHIPCAHIISTWQYCVAATRSGTGKIRPCWNVHLEKHAELSRNLCEDCDDDPFRARSRDVTEHGNRSLSTAPQSPKLESEDEDGNDSGYHSDVIHEENEQSSIDEQPLSPQATSPRHSKQRKRTSSRQRTVTRRPSWKPSLKRDLSLEDISATCIRRDSIDSVLAVFDSKIWQQQPGLQMSNIMDRRQSRKLSRDLGEHRRRGSTLLHPSSPPPMEITSNAQVARAFPFPDIVVVQKTCPNRQDATHMRKNSTLLHPSPPPEEEPTAHKAAPRRSSITTNARVSKHRPAAPKREVSTLLHPSNSSDMAPPMSAHRTVLRVPPTRPVSSTREHSSIFPSTHSRRASAQLRNTPARRQPPLQSTASEPITNTMARRRQRSILHSSLSDSEDSGFDEPTGSRFGEIKFALDVFGAANSWSSNAKTHQANHGSDEFEDILLASSADAARAKREGVRMRMNHF